MDWTSTCVSVDKREIVIKPVIEINLQNSFKPLLEGLDEDSQWLMRQVVDPAFRAETLAMHPKHILHVISVLPYGSLIRVGIKWYFYTGCRLCEIERMYVSEIKYGWIVWKLRKSQRVPRKEYLGPELIQEMHEMRKHEKTKPDYIFPVTGETFVQYFNKQVRPLLPPIWRLKHPFPKKGNSLNGAGEYIYQLKLIRKTFATLRFWYHYKKYGNADIAFNNVAKEMKHSTAYMSRDHYIACAAMIEAEKYYTMLPHEVLDKMSQSQLVDFWNWKED